tara:strand:- start:150 stop:281 length:132 start_codon:yes stop_codon:yes gene_type:complete
MVKDVAPKRSFLHGKLAIEKTKKRWQQQQHGAGGNKVHPHKRH